jgi:hypothetical protein
MGQPERLSTETCKANATPELARMAMWESDKDVRLDINVAVLQDTKDLQALSCITNPEVPGKLQQVWAKALAETMLRRYRRDMNLAIK